jgi:AhpD family alkylhydroperoxidase
MAGWLVRTALRRTLSQIRYVTPVDPRRASGRVGDVYRQAERDFGLLAPPLALHSPAPGALTASWAMLRESLVADGAVERPAKELVAAAVSAANSCPYCVEVHGATLWGLTRNSDAEAVAAGTPAEVTDPAARAMLAWAGGTGPWPAGRPEAEAAELMGVAVTFHYLNRMVSVFLGESPLPPTVPAGARGRARRVLGAIMGRAARGGRPGDALRLFDGPADTAPEWAAGNATIAAAFGHAAAALDAPSVPDPVREMVAGQLAAWDGEPVGLSRSWVEDAVATLPAADRDAGRLAVLTAKAAYQVDEDVVAAFRRTDPSDAALVELTSWAAHAAARHAGDRIRGVGMPGTTPS